MGNTVLAWQLIQDLLESGVTPRHVLYVAFDELPTMRGLAEPVLTVCRWFQHIVPAATFNQAASRGMAAYVLCDKLQNVEAWAALVKSLMDNNTVRVLVTGSSSLRIEAGRDSSEARHLNETKINRATQHDPRLGRARPET